MNRKGHGTPFSTIGLGICLVVAIFLVRMALTGEVLSGRPLLALAVVLMIGSIIAFLPF